MNTLSIDYPDCLTSEIIEWAEKLGPLEYSSSDEYWSTVDAMDQGLVYRMCSVVNLNRTEIDAWLDKYPITDYKQTGFVYMGLLQALDDRGSLS